MPKLDKKTIGNLSYYAVFTNGVLFRDFWRPVYGAEDFYQTRYYQYPEAISESLVFLAGRGVGKSIGMEMWVVQQMLINSKCEGILTSLRSLHTRDRMESVIGMFRKIQYFNQFLENRSPIRRQPTYEIRLKNGVKMYGIAIGDDPQAVNMTGKHAKFRCIEETQFYPEFAYIQFQGTEHPSGSTDRFIGVPDGKVNSVFRKLDTIGSSFERLHITKKLDPLLTFDKLKGLYKSYGGKTSSVALNQIDALWGEPTSSGWNLEVIKNCMIMNRHHPDYRAYVVNIEKEAFTEAKNRPDVFLYNLPLKSDAKKYLIGIDVGGGSQPTVILVFADYDYRFQLIARVNIKGKITSPQQADIIDFVYRFYRDKAETIIGMDCSGGEGRSLADILETKNSAYKNCLYRIEFQSSLIIGEEVDEYGKKKIKKENLKELTVRVLRELFNKINNGSKCMTLPYDGEIIEDFGSEINVWDSRFGKYRLHTPDDVHIPEAMRCFAYLVYMLYEYKIPRKHQISEFIMPEMDEAPQILRR